MSSLSTIRLPIPWDEFDLPNPFAGRDVVLTTGEPTWGWTGTQPNLGVEQCANVPGDKKDGWDIDHVVLLVPSLDETIDAMAAIGHAPRLRLVVGDRPTAFFRTGTLLECVESPVRQAALFGVALVTDDPLEVVVLRWRSMGRSVNDPKPAIQPGRRIFVVTATEAGFAVMSPDRELE